MKLNRVLRVLAVVLAAAARLSAQAAPGPDTLEAQIDAFIGRIEASGRGARWVGADTFAIEDGGDTAIIANARLSLRSKLSEGKPPATLILDRLEVRRKPYGDGGKSTEFDITLPAHAKLLTRDGDEITADLKDATMTAIVEAPGERLRAITLAIAGGSVGLKGKASRGTVGPIVADWNLVRGDGEAWTASTNLDIRNIEILAAEYALITIERIDLRGEAAGPSLAEYDSLGDRRNEVRARAAGDPQQQLAGWLPLLREYLRVCPHATAEFTVAGEAIKEPSGDPIATLAKATFGGAVDGLDGDTPSARMSLGYDGLDIAAAQHPEPAIPRHFALGVSLGLPGEQLRRIVDAASHLDPSVPETERQIGIGQLIGLGLTLAPVLRVSPLTIDWPGTSIEASGETKGAMLSGSGYSVTGDATVHGFDGLLAIVASPRERAYLPLLKFLATAADGGTALKFHVAWSRAGTTLNGTDIAPWFAPAHGEPRVLRLEAPPLKGDDVRAVQKAVAKNRVEPFGDGIYDTATALAVARFQKEAGLDPNGVVDAPTRDKLGIPPPTVTPTPAPSSRK